MKEVFSIFLLTSVFCEVALGQHSHNPISTKPQIATSRTARAIPNTLEEIVDPTHTAVIVHEMVRDIVARYEPAQIERLLGPIQRILASARTIYGPGSRCRTRIFCWMFYKPDLFLAP